ncbi:MAG: glycosyltransferase [Acidobacteriota bacterium]
MPEPSPQEIPQGLRVSAILLAYNQAASVRRALTALESSRERDRLEIIVVDYASQDGTARLDTEFPAINMMRLPHHMGSARAMNIATRTAKADLLLFLSPDVEVTPDTVSALATRLQSEPDTVAACPLLLDPHGQPAPRIFRLPNREALTAAAQGSPLPTVPIDAAADNVVVEFPSLDALMVRRSFVQAMNYFDQRYGHYWTDAELAMQIRRAGKKIRCYPGIHATIHAEPDPLQNEKLAATDRMVGASEFLGKYEGGGFSFRLNAALGSLARFDFGRFSSLLSGQKLDGSQAH